MDELINLVVKKTGLSQDDARKAVEVVVNALKSNLPGPIASQLDSFLSGGFSGGVNNPPRGGGELLNSKLGGPLCGFQKTLFFLGFFRDRALKSAGGLSLSPALPLFPPSA